MAKFSFPSRTWVAGNLVWLVLLLGACANLPPLKPGPTTPLAQKMEEVESTLNGLFSAVESEDLGAFFDRVSRDRFLGNRSTLETRLRQQLLEVQLVRYQYSVGRVIFDGENHVEVRIRWDRRWRLESSGKEVLRSGQSLFRFVSTEAGMRLQQIRGDNPFF